MGISNAVVIGGGIGGLAAATALAQRGVAVTLLEQAPKLEDVGAGLQVSPNGLAVMRALGLEASLRQKCAVLGQAVVLNSEGSADEVARLDLTRLKDDQRYYFMHRADLVDVLAGAAKRQNVTFEMGAEVASVKPGPLPEVLMADGTRRRAELVVAADGLHSVARGVLNGPDDAKFSGQVAWRATVENRFDHPDEVHVAMGSGRHLVSYPIRDGREINLVAVEEREAWAPEGWQEPDNPANLRKGFAGFQGRAAAMIGAVETVTLWGLHLHPVAPIWQREGVVMLGDAAHPTLPFLAQGANMALEDAYVLATCAATGGTDWASQYQAQRFARVARVVKAAERNAWRYHLRPGLVRSVAHFGLSMGSRFAPGRMLGAYDWLYGFDVTRSPQQS